MTSSHGIEHRYSTYQWPRGSDCHPVHSFHDFGWWEHNSTRRESESCPLWLPNLGAHQGNHPIISQLSSAALHSLRLLAHWSLMSLLLLHRPHRITSWVGGTLLPPHDDKLVHLINHTSILPSSYYHRPFTTDLPYVPVNYRTGLLANPTSQKHPELSTTLHIIWSSLTSDHHQHWTLLIHHDSNGSSYGKEANRDGSHDPTDP